MTTLADLLDSLNNDAGAGRYARPEAATGNTRGRKRNVEGAGYDPEHHGAATVRACADVHLSDEFIPPY